MKIQTKNFTTVAKLNDHDYYMDDAGVIRWVSNNQVPPIDILELAWLEDVIGRSVLKRSLDTKFEEDTKAIANYIASRKNNGYSLEELFEIGASFDKGDIVVDVFTGQKIIV